MLTKAQADEIKRLADQTGPIWDCTAFEAYIDSLTAIRLPERPPAPEPVLKG